MLHFKEKNPICSYGFISILNLVWVVSSDGENIGRVTRVSIEQSLDLVGREEKGREGKRREEKGREGKEGKRREGYHKNFGYTIVLCAHPIETSYPFPPSYVPIL